MKMLILFSVFIGHFCLALGITDFISDFATGDAEKLCSKRAKVDRPKCNDFIKGKRFRKEFLSVCFKVNEKMGPDHSLSCLEAIADKSTQTSSRTQAETCEELVGSKNPDWVLGCVKANVIEDYAKLCSRYVDGGKAYKSAATCIQTLNDYTIQDLDMPRFRGGCMQIKDKKDFAKEMTPCLVNAENQSSAITGRTPKIQELQKIEAQQ